jgi:hypothetical protein
MSEFNINIGDKYIKINKLDTNEYEFIMNYEYLQYYGKSFLKEIKIDKFSDYINFYEQKEEILLIEIDGDFHLKFPIPFSYNYETIILKKPEISEIDEIKLLLKKQRDEFKQIITEQQYEIQKLKTKINPNKQYIIIDRNYFHIHPKYFTSFKEFIIKNIDKMISKEDMNEKIIYNIKQSESSNDLVQHFRVINQYISFRCIFDYLKEQNCFINDIIIDNRSSQYYEFHLYDQPNYTGEVYIKYMIEFISSENKMIDYTTYYNKFLQNYISKYDFKIIKFISNNNTKYTLFITYE